MNARPRSVINQSARPARSCFICMRLNESGTQQLTHYHILCQGSFHACVSLFRRCASSLSNRTANNRKSTSRRARSFHSVLASRRRRRRFYGSLSRKNSSKNSCSTQVSHGHTRFVRLCVYKYTYNIIHTPLKRISLPNLVSLYDDCNASAHISFLSRLQKPNKKE